MRLSRDFIEKLDMYIEKGYVSATHHNTLDIRVLCYTKTTQYESVWDEITTVCRGLVVDDDNVIVGHAMPKFFNYGPEMDRLGLKVPNLDYTVYEKMDGSLIHMWYYDDRWNFSSKGSFVWEGIEEAKSIFEEKYSYGWLDKNCTYCFELISPINKIVVDYHGRRDLVLLNVIDFTGVEVSPDALQSFSKKYGFSMPKTYDCEDFEKLRRDYAHLKGTEHEGFVIRFENGFRMKVKLDNYLILHRVFSNFSPLEFHRNIDLKTLRVDRNFLKDLPEEFREQTDAIVDYLETNMITEWDKIVAMAESVPNFSTAKERFLYVSENFPLDKSNVVNYLNGKIDSVREHVWKKFRPTGNKLVGE